MPKSRGMNVRTTTSSASLNSITTAPETELMEYEVIDVQLIDEDLDPYHEVLRAIRENPYYVPDKRELLAYDNPFYWENTPRSGSIPHLPPDQPPCRRTRWKRFS